MSDASRIYPQSIPYQPPPNPAVHEARLRRWTTLLVLTTIVSLGFVIGMGFFLVRQMKAQIDHRVAALELRASADSPEGGSPSETEDPPEKTVGPKEPSDPQAKEPEPEFPRDTFLEVIGNLISTHLYQSYLNIGLLADCTEAEVYTTEDAQKWLDRTVAQLELVDKQLDILKTTKLKPEERPAVDKCRQASFLLRTQAKELREYWKNSDKDHAARYHKARETAWAKVGEVLQLPKDSD